MFHQDRLVSGIVGAGGNVGAVAAGFLLKAEAVSWPTAFFILGAIVTCSAFLSFAVRFSESAETDARTAAQAALSRGGKLVEPVSA